MWLVVYLFSRDLPTKLFHDVQKFTLGSWFILHQVSKGSDRTSPDGGMGVRGNGKGPDPISKAVSIGEESGVLEEVVSPKPGPCMDHVTVAGSM